MKFGHLYRLLFESPEISRNIQNYSAQDTWAVASDIRKHIGDHMDVNIGAIIYDFVLKREGKGKNDHALYNPLYYSPTENLCYVITPTRPVFSIYKVTLDDLKWYHKDDWLDNWSLKDRRRTYYIDNYVRHIQGYKHRWFNEKESSENNKTMKEMIKSGNKTFIKIANQCKRATNITAEDKNRIMNHFGVTTGDIYNYLIDTTHDLHKHPTEIPKELHDLPRPFLETMTTQSISPAGFALKSKRETNKELDRDLGLAYDGFARVMESNDENTATDGPFKPQKKESFEWLMYIAKSSNRIENKRQQEENRYDDYDEGYSHYSDALTVYNFPSWIILKKSTPSEYLADSPFLDGTFHGRDLSFQSWMTFRWFIQNYKSTYFYKDIQAHGPANQQQTFKPITQIVQICNADLVNGLKTSPEIAFQNAARRAAEGFDRANAHKEFKYHEEFEDLPTAKVIKNSIALKKEGERMSHCVGGYSQSCLSQKSLIIALPKSTAELDPVTFKVYQHRGFDNSQPPAEDVQELQKWMQLNKDKRGLI